MSPVPASLEYINRPAQGVSGDNGRSCADVAGNIGDRRIRARLRSKLSNRRAEEHARLVEGASMGRDLRDRHCGIDPFPSTTPKVGDRYGGVGDDGCGGESSWRG
jgi:hypothetical protein